MSLDERHEDGFSMWVRDVGRVDEIDRVITTYSWGGEIKPADLYSAAETRLLDNAGEDRLPGRALMWAAASLGDRRACTRLAEEIEGAVRAGEFSAPEEEAVAVGLAAMWRRKGNGRLDLAALSRRARADHALPLPGKSRNEAPAHHPVGAAGKVVVRTLGDVASPDGTSLFARYADAVDVALPAKGKMPEAGKVKAEIGETWPWAAHVGPIVEGRLSLLRSAGVEAVRLRPLLFVGPPGGGKTSLARRIAEMLGLPVTVIPAAGSSDGATLSAVTRDWRNSRPCGPVIAAIESGCSNPVIVIDEVDKAVGIGNRNGSVVGTLLGMIGDPERYYDACLMSEVDLSWVTFMATANDLHGIPEPLLDRFEIVRMGRPGVEHLPVILANLRVAEARSLGVDPRLLPELDAAEAMALRRSYADGMSLRTLGRAFRHMLGEAAAREAELLPN